ncbi:hypothetical protein BGZ99_001614 [Dissophora globulifera]|uniref:FAD-binding domain-containing protein n=1 Tax=Dissophora globulifera TaxID=979702 RepID=A0A9P6RTB6_9FUNG|nr:hypothetical protein BGZ99_001614 [Dissophora globulifera]
MPDVPPPPPASNTKVLIAGAGVAGLTLAILLDKAGIAYEIFERQEHIKPQGSAAALGFNIMPLMEQLGLLDELKSISKVVDGTTLYKEDMEVIREIRLRDNRALTGYDTLVTSRPEFHALLTSRVSKDKIHMNKHIVGFTQDIDSVTISCADGTIYTGDILVGADGAYSSVRKILYRQMKDEGILPASDEVELLSHYLSILGTTRPLDPKNYEGLEDDDSHSDAVIGNERGLSWRYFTIPHNRVCWRIDVQAKDMDPALYENWLNAEYNVFDVTQLPEEWKHHKLPIMGELKDLFDSSPKESISKVVLEDRVYETWKHGRTVLIGDAAHKVADRDIRKKENWMDGKFNGRAMNAILDGVVLANLLYEMSTPSQKNINKALDEFYTERFPSVTKELNATQQMLTVLAGKTWLDSAARFVLLKLVPKYFKEKSQEYTLQYRPQALFLPSIESRGSVPNTPQRPSRKYTALQKNQAAATAAAAAVTAAAAAGIAASEVNSDSSIS